MISGVTPPGLGIGHVAAPGSPGSPGARAAGASGGNVFTEALSNVDTSLRQADSLSTDLATGQLTDVHELLGATAKAQLGVELTVAVRNRAVEAFQEIMRMQV